MFDNHLLTILKKPTTPPPSPPKKTKQTKHAFIVLFIVQRHSTLFIGISYGINCEMLVYKSETARSYSVILQ